MLVVLGVHVQIIMIVAVDYTATIRGLAMCVHHVLILCGLAMHTIQSTINVALVTLMVLMILHLISPTQVLGTVVAINWIAEYLKKCVSASAMGITACACDTDRGKVAGLHLVLLPGSFFLYVFLYVGVSNVVVLRNLPKS